MVVYHLALSRAMYAPAELPVLSKPLTGWLLNVVTPRGVAALSLHAQAGTSVAAPRLGAASHAEPAPGARPRGGGEAACSKPLHRSCARTGEREDLAGGGWGEIYLPLSSNPALGSCLEEVFPGCVLPAWRPSLPTPLPGAPWPQPQVSALCPEPLCSRCPGGARPCAASSEPGVGQRALLWRSRNDSMTVLSFAIQKFLVPYTTK